MVADPSVSPATDGQAVWMLTWLRFIMGSVHKMADIAHLLQVGRYTYHCVRVVYVSWFDRVLAVMEVCYGASILGTISSHADQSGGTILSSPKVLWISTTPRRGCKRVVWFGWYRRAVVYYFPLLSEALWRTVKRHNTYVRREGGRYRRIHGSPQHNVEWDKRTCKHPMLELLEITVSRNKERAAGQSSRASIHFGSGCGALAYACFQLSEHTSVEESCETGVNNKQHRIRKKCKNERQPFTCCARSLTTWAAQWLDALLQSP